MACAGVVASAGAQLDLFFITKGTRTYTIQSGKSTITIYERGFRTSPSFGSVSYAIGSGMRIKGGAEHELIQLYHTGLSTIYVTFKNPKVGGSTGDNAPEASFTSIVLHNPQTSVRQVLKLADDDITVSPGDSSTQWMWIETEAGVNTNNDTVIPCELRAD